MHIDDSSCPCFSGQPYSSCCKPYHKGASAKTAKALMRARFAAYRLNLPEFIIATTHPGNSEYCDNLTTWAREISAFCEQTTFTGLDILHTEEAGLVSTVTFKACLLQGKEDISFSEKSFFEQIHGKWLYKGALVLDAKEPTLLTKKPLKILPLAYYGQEILRKKASFISSITPEIRMLIEGMIETMDATDGIGLAAPQVHHSVQLFIMRKPVMEGKNLVFKQVEVFINPLILEFSEDLFREQEGCLSIPHIRHAVSRPKTIKVEYTTLEGERSTEVFSGWEAKIIQHEYDHLQGLFFIDRLEPKEQSKLSSALKKLETRLHDHKSL